MLTCVIIEDEIIAITQLKRLLQPYENINLLRSFTNANDGLDYVLKNDVDIVFLDIKLPQKSGIDIAKIISHKTTIILTTSTSKYALDGFNLGVTDYLLKPIMIDRFAEAIKKALSKIEYENINNSDTSIKKEQTTISIIADRKVYRIDVNDILYIESKKEYLKIFTEKISIMSLGALKDIIEQLPKNNFIRIHKSYIINKSKIESYSLSNVIMLNKAELAVGRIYRNEFKTAIKN